MEWDTLDEEVKEKYRYVAREAIWGLYYCNRVWFAWRNGTMTEDDFGLASDDDEQVEETAYRIYKQLKNY
jgi:hypothetical protein